MRPLRPMKRRSVSIRQRRPPIILAPSCACVWIAPTPWGCCNWRSGWGQGIQVRVRRWVGRW